MSRTEISEAKAGLVLPRNVLNEPGFTPKTWLYALLVFVLAFAVYLPSLGGDFIWDDEILLRSPTVQELRPLGEYFKSAFLIRPEMEPEGRGFYRPLTILTLAWDRAIHGETSAGFHLTNLLVHAANAVLVFYLCRRLRAGQLVATLLALLFACFPRLTEAVAWISGRTDVLATFFSISALLIVTSQLRWKYAWASLALFGGLLAKEVTLAALLGVLFLGWREAPRSRRVHRLMFPALAFFSYLVLRTIALQGSSPPNILRWSDRAWAVLEAWGRYAFMLVNGFQPRAQIGFLTHRDWLFVSLGGAVLGALFLLLWKIRKRCTLLQQALLLVGLSALALVCQIIPLPLNVVACDRFLYLSVACFIPLSVPLFLGKYSRVTTVGAVMLLLGYATATWGRSQVWVDKISFWSTLYREQSIHNGMSRISLGSIYQQKGLFVEADKIYADADQLDWGNYLGILHLRAMLRLSTGGVSESVSVLKQVTAEYPLPLFGLSLARAYVAGDEVEDARKVLDGLREQYPRLLAAEEMTRALPQLEQAHARLKREAHTTMDHVERAWAMRDLGFSRLALKEYLVVLEREDLPPQTLAEIMSFAFDAASPTELERIYEVFDAREPSPYVTRVLEERRREVARLTELFEGLGLP